MITKCRLTAQAILRHLFMSTSGAVSLHFNRCEVQSAMYKHAPDELVLSYTRTMMSFLVFNKQPRHVGMIGLGGGSMPKYCYRHLPDTTISVAEINPEVIALRDRFLVPKDDHRFQNLLRGWC